VISNILCFKWSFECSSTPRLETWQGLMNNINYEGAMQQMCCNVSVITSSGASRASRAIKSSLRNRILAALLCQHEWARGQCHSWEDDLFAVQSEAFGIQHYSLASGKRPSYRNVRYLHLHVRRSVWVLSCSWFRRVDFNDKAHTNEWLWDLTHVK
jgi:hypothetical protein